MNVNDIVQRVTNDFSDIYPHFKEFQQSPECRPYWDKCIESIADRDFLTCVIFCNDVFAIPPVKTFLTYYREDFIRLIGDKDKQAPQSNIFLKRSIGAFWGMVFKIVLGYKNRESVSVSNFFVKTASVYSGRGTPVIIE